MAERTPLPVPPQIAAIAPDGNLTPRQRRRFMLDMVRRRQKPGTGSSHEFLRRRTADIQWPDLRSVLAGIPWALTGDVATRAYMAERMTQRMDVLVHERDVPAAWERLKAMGYASIAQSSEPSALFRSPNGVAVKVIGGRYSWLDAVLAHPECDAAGYPVIALPYLALLKMQATDMQDWADVTRMLCTATDEQITEIRKIIAEHSPDDSEDLEIMIWSARLEMAIPDWAE